MSHTPAPVSLTAAHLMLRSMLTFSLIPKPTPHQIADLASRLHRLAKGAMRASVAECNGEMYEGQRESINQRFSGKAMHCIVERVDAIKSMESSVAVYANRIDRAIAKLNTDLAPLAIEAHRNGDPRGYAIKLRSTDPTRPLPSNEMGGAWGIA